jgi:hypothetical protein
MIGKAKVIKRKTNDGLIELEDHVLLGKIYEVDLSSRRILKGKNIEKSVFWSREMILAEGSWFPIELLEIL